MIEKFIEVLEGVGLEPTAEEIADYLWLANHLHSNANEIIHSDPKKVETPQSTSIEERDSEAEQEYEPLEQEGTAEVHSETQAISEFEQGSSRGIPIRVPAGPALPGTLAISRAFRPLARRIPSTTQFILDELKTAHQSAEINGLLTVVQKPVSRRWLDIALIVDHWPSMDIWRKTVVEYQHLLEHQGAFNNIQVWSVFTEPEDGSLQLRAGLGMVETSPQIRDPRELIDPKGERLILILSDCVSPAWSNGNFADLIALWGRDGMVAIVQMFPQSLWERTALNMSAPVYLRSTQPGTSNRKLLAESARWYRKMPVDGVKVPVISLEPRLIAAWAQSMIGSVGVWIPGFVLSNGSVNETDDALAFREADWEYTARDLLQEYYASASPMARKLATCLAAVPLTLPIMHLVQRAVLPESKQFHLAEFFLSGLIYKIETEENAQRKPDEIEFDFVEGVRELLIGDGAISQTLEVISIVSEYVNRYTGQRFDFPAYLADPNSDSELVIQKGSRSFAWLTAQVLKRLGGQYEQMGINLEKKALNNEMDEDEIKVESFGGSVNEEHFKSEIEKPHTTEGAFQSQEAQSKTYSSFRGNYHRNYLRRIQECLYQHFDKDELKLLCAGVGLKYEDLPADGWPEQCLELVEWANQHGRIKDLVGLVRKRRPSACVLNIYIGYKLGLENDALIAEYLKDYFDEKGYDVFLEGNILPGRQQVAKREDHIKQADYFIALLSAESAQSELLQFEISHAYQISQDSFPRILPVRIQYDEPYPYNIDYYLNPLPYALWEEEAENENLARELLAAIEGGRLKGRKKIKSTPSPVQGIITLTEDGDKAVDDEVAHPPRPEIDPRLLGQLDHPSGTVRLRDKFYIKRKADNLLIRELAKKGSITTIRASRQTGKSSLMIRGIQHYRETQMGKPIFLDMQRVETQKMQTLDGFLHYLADFIARELLIPAKTVEEIWQNNLGSQDKMMEFMSQHVLSDVRFPILLALDEVDRLFGTPAQEGFFRLLRSWYNQAAVDPRWEKLSIIMVISTEPYLLIQNVNQSPFNVGLLLYLEDFDREQVRDLNERHGSPIRQNEFEMFWQLFNGHPYLTRQALYTLVTYKISWVELNAVAADDTGPFGDHLSSLLWKLVQNDNLLLLMTHLKQVIDEGQCDDVVARLRLLRAGIIKGSGDIYQTRCGLYHRYFADKL